MKKENLNKHESKSEYTIFENLSKNFLTFGKFIHPWTSEPFFLSPYINRYQHIFTIISLVFVLS